jgi:sulfoxide reductase heme-binding subunit YedZ
MPWLDPRGRFSPFKLGVFLLLFVPATLIFWRYASGALGAEPVEAALHQAGDWAIRLLLVSLAVTPARHLLQWPRLAQVRRMVGVAAFAYAAAHLALYVTDEGFNLGKVASEIVLRLYLTLGFLAFLVLAAMALTSFDGMIRRLGAKRWKQLHRLVYGVGLVAVVHFFMQTKLDATEPWIIAGLLAWLLAVRVVIRQGGLNGAMADWWPLAVGLLVAAGTAIGEAFYYRALVGVAPSRMLAANLSIEAGIRPAWYVLAICLAVALVIALRRSTFRADRLARGTA